MSMQLVCAVYLQQHFVRYIPLHCIVGGPTDPGRHMFVHVHGCQMQPVHVKTKGKRREHSWGKRGRGGASRNQGLLTRLGKLVIYMYVCCELSFRCSLCTELLVIVHRVLVM